MLQLRREPTEYTYDVDGKQKTIKLPSGGINETFYDDCCGKYTGTQDAEGGQRISVANNMGQPVYSAVLDGTFNFATGNYLDPDNAITLGETTTRYDDNGRAIFKTVWKQALGGNNNDIDPQTPPIAGLDSVPLTVSA